MTTIKNWNAHRGAILLLDEPGLTLHPLAQRDLSRFFESLAESNQIIFTTHSPFLIDADKLDRVKAVYVNDQGYSVITSDLRSAAPKSIQEQSIYAAHAALGLSVSDVLLQGCQPVIVEGQSDQYYLAAIKAQLISAGKLSPGKEIVFMPCGGLRGIKAVTPILAAKQEELLMIIVDSDGPGKAVAKQLRSDLYKGQEDRVIEIDSISLIKGSEVEDLIPPPLLAEAFSRQFRTEEDLSDSLVPDKPIVEQMENFAKKHQIKSERSR